MNSSEKQQIYRLGIMDSGMGGLSVLSDIIRKRPNIEFIYFADFLNSPYGDKSKEIVRECVESVVQKLLSENAQSILLACNTATSVAVDYLRQRHDEPIFGMEPAIKPALNDSNGSRILVLATSLTLQEDRFLSLKNRVDPMNRVVASPCPGLSDLIDKEDWSGAIDYVSKILNSYPDIHSVVLGCTHYVFLEELLIGHFPRHNFFHGNTGTTNHILRSIPLSTTIEKDDGDYINNRIQFISNIEDDKYIDRALSFTKKRLDHLNRKFSGNLHLTQKIQEKISQ